MKRRIIRDPSEIYAALTSKKRGLGPGTYVKQDDDQITVFKRGRLLAAKRLIPSSKELRRLAKEIDLPWDGELAKRVIPYWASDERVDSHGDIVKQNWDFAEFDGNPILAYSHDWVGPPIGNGLKREVVDRKEGDYDGPALFMLAVFAKRKTYAWADDIFKLVKARVLRSCSVGFFSQKVIDVTDEEERQALGLGQYGYVLDKNMLVELSPTPVGANAGAFSLVSRAKREVGLEASAVDCIRELRRMDAVRGLSDADSWKKDDNDLVRMGKLLFPDGEFVAHKDVDEPFTPQEIRRVTRHLRKTTKQEDEEMEEKLDALTTLVEEGLLGVTSMLSDIQSMVEEALDTEEVPDEEEEELETDELDEDEDEDEEEEKTEEDDDEEDEEDEEEEKSALEVRLERSLRKLRKARLGKKTKRRKTRKRKTVGTARLDRVLKALRGLNREAS